MTTKYFISKYTLEIEARPVVREIDGCYLIRDNRNNRAFKHPKEGPNHRYFDTWREAHQWAVGEVEAVIRHHAERLNSAKQLLSKVLEMKP
jgi:hypothetical protein